MEHAAAGVARLVLALMELPQRTETLLAEHRQLQAERAAGSAGRWDSGRP